MALKVTFKNNPLTLVGRELKVGSSAPSFKAVTQDLKEVTLDDFSRTEIKESNGIPPKAGKGKIKIITSFPSLDTPVCDLQVKEFNKRASGMLSDVVIIGVSKDLPFAQKRFCSENNITAVNVVSDYKTSSVGINWGLLIKELGLLARAVIIVDAQDVVRYIQIVSEITSPPDYEAVLQKLQEIIRVPKVEVKSDQLGSCKPCEGGALSLPKEKMNALLAQRRGWELIEEKKLVKEIVFKDYAEAVYALDLIATLADEQGHHPVMTLSYQKLKITLFTHAAGGLTDNDFIMAGIIDEMNLA